MWDKRAVVLTGGEVSEDEEGEEVSTPAKRSLKDKDPVVKSEPNMGAKTIEPVVAAMDADEEIWTWD